MSNARLALDVMAELAAESRLDSSRIGVTVTSDGTAFLSGVVDTARERERAADRASRVTGVRSVRNEIAVAPVDAQRHGVESTRPGDGQSAAGAPPRAGGDAG